MMKLYEVNPEVRHGVHCRKGAGHIGFFSLNKEKEESKPGYLGRHE